MKHFVVLLVLTLIGLSVNSQQHSYTVFDTIEQYPNKTFVHFKIYKDSILFEDSHAFLYHTTVKISRFNILRKIFMTRVPADSIVYHGSSIKYYRNRYHKIEKYEKGELILTNYMIVAIKVNYQMKCSGALRINMTQRLKSGTRQVSI